MKKTNKLFKIFGLVMLSSGLSISTSSLAEGNHTYQHGHDDAKSGHMMSGGDMGKQMNKQMESHMREVVGEGRINKIMQDRHMVNINHGPIPELKWPKMRMNFKAQKQVNLSELELGQEVNFTLLVGGENNYVIKEITVKK